MWESLPLNVRLFLESLIGETKPITEKDLTSDELQVLKGQAVAKYVNEPAIRGNMMRARIKQSIEYPDSLFAMQYSPQTYARLIDKSYETPKNIRPQVSYLDYRAAPDDANWLQAINKTYNSPEFRIGTALGKFGIKDIGDAYEVYDTYNWKNDFDRPITSLKDVFEVSEFSKPTSVLNALAALYAPKVDRPIKIKVNK